MVLYRSMGWFYIEAYNTLGNVIMAQGRLLGVTRPTKDSLKHAKRTRSSP